MKKMIIKNLAAVILVVMLLSLGLNSMLQFQDSQKSMIKDSKALFGQVERMRSLEQTAEDEWTEIFTILLSNTGVNLYAANINTGEILGSTDSSIVGNNLADIGLEAAIESGEKGFTAWIDGTKRYCYFQQSGDVLLGRSCTYTYLCRNIGYSLLVQGILLSVVALILIVSVAKYLNKNIVLTIADINNKLKEITEGNLDAKVEAQTTPEFVELSGHINEMVKSLLETTEKLSRVLDYAELSIGVYEYGPGMARVRATRQVPHILCMSEEKAEKALENYILFADYLDVVRANPFDEEKLIFRIPGEEEKYVKIEAFQKETSIFGLVADVTETVMEQLRLEQERDFDILTGLHRRRALYSVLDKKFEEPKKLQNSAFIIVDADDLKKVNDKYGHAAGDQYLCGVAKVLQAICPEKSEVARLGGDEFVVFIYDCESQNEVERYIDSLKEKRGKITIITEEGTEVPIQFSLGCAFCPEEGVDYHKLLKMADEHMYEEKRKRKQKI